jgi:hypothetical protein
MEKPHPSFVARSLFAGAVVRLERGSEHLADIKLRLDRLRQSNPDRVVDEGDPDIVYIAQLRPPHDRYPMLPVSDVLMISVVIGELIHNLRAALDYLIYGLAWIDSKRFHKMTQFPIYSCEDDFTRDGLTKLKGLSDEHIARIKELQPYNGCHWTRTLARLSNRDKHRELIKMFPVNNFALQLGVRFPKPIESNAEATESEDWEVKLVDPPAFYKWCLENTVKVNLTLTGDVTLSDGTPIIDTLEILKSQVSNLLGEFEDIFLLHGQSA